MLKLGIKHFTINIVINCFIIIQLSAVFFIILLSVSSYRSRFALYEPISPLLHKKGEIIFVNSEKQKDYEDFNNLVGKNGIKEIALSYVANLGNQSINGQTIDSNLYYNLLILDDSLIDLYSPDLSEGNWIQSNMESECVLGHGDIGETIDIPFYTFEGEQITIKYRVCGIISDRSKLIYSTRFDALTENCNDIISTYYRKLDIENNKNTIIIKASMLKKHNIHLKPSGIGYVIYENNISDNQIKKAELELNKLCGHTDFENVDKNSHIFINEQLYILIPVLICTAALAFLCVISSTAIQTKKSLRNYSIYFINGSKWNHLCIISVIEIVIDNILAILLGFSLCHFSIIITNNSLTYYRAIDLLFILGVVVFSLFCSIIMPMIIIKNVSPKKVLYNTD